MNKTLKKVVIALIAALAVCAVGLVCYETMFKNADILKLGEDGKLEGIKSTYLTARRGENYYKLADVSAPKGYSTKKGVSDPDGDPLTTFMAYAKKDTTEGEVYAVVYAYPGDEQSVLENGFEQTVLRYTGSEKGGSKDKTDITAYVKTGETVLCLLASPYDDMFICCELTCPESFTAEQLLSECYNIAYKVTPGKQLHSLVADFKLNFIDDSRWMYLLKGLGTTMLITLLSTLMGIVLGAIVASVRSTWQMNNENMRPSFGKWCLKVLDKLCGVYLTVIRGTPVMVQLLIMYLLIFASSSNGTFSAIMAFGINSGAYVAEIVRGGIVSIDRGQFEAGRSLGFNYLQTMIHIILPQVFKNILPALANEFIALLKETSVSGYVAVKDLNKGGDIIRSVTYSPFLPLIAVALIYLAVVMFFTRLVGILERRLQTTNEHSKHI